MIEGEQIMEYKIEKWETMDLLVHAKDFHAETSEAEIPIHARKMRPLRHVLTNGAF